MSLIRKSKQPDKFIAITVTSGMFILRITINFLVPERKDLRDPRGSNSSKTLIGLSHNLERQDRMLHDVIQSYN